MFYEKQYSQSNTEYNFYEGDNVIYPSHLHRYFEFYKVIDGKSEITIRGQKYTLSKGEGVLIFPNQPHSYDDSTECKHQMCIFSPALINRFYVDTKTKQPKTLKFDCSTLNQPPSCADNIYAIKGFLYSLVGLFTTQVALNDKGKSDNTIENILIYLSDHYKDDCSLHEIAEHLGYEYTYVSKLFKKNLGIGMSEYVCNLRISEAKRLIKETDMSFTDIAYSCGFNSIRTFNRVFNSVCGMTPTKFKEK